MQDSRARGQEPAVIAVSGFTGACRGLQKLLRHKSGRQQNCHTAALPGMSQARLEERAGQENKFRFIVEMEICVVALKIWFYVCV